jgi:hypothetical protein
MTPSDHIVSQLSGVGLLVDGFMYPPLPGSSPFEALYGDVPYISGLR